MTEDIQFVTQDENKNAIELDYNDPLTKIYHVLDGKGNRRKIKFVNK